jgi:hypothetical protein
MGQGQSVLGVEPANSSGMRGRAAARESRRYELELEVVERSR